MRFLKQKLPGGIQIDLQFSCLMQKFFDKSSLIHSIKWSRKSGSGKVPRRVVMHPLVPLDYRGAEQGDLRGLSPFVDDEKKQLHFPCNLFFESLVVRNPMFTPHYVAVTYIPSSSEITSYPFPKQFL